MKTIISFMDGRVQECAQYCKVSVYVGSWGRVKALGCASVSPGEQGLEGDSGAVAYSGNGPDWGSG